MVDKKMKGRVVGKVICNYGKIHMLHKWDVMKTKRKSFGRIMEEGNTRNTRY